MNACELVSIVMFDDMGPSEVRTMLQGSREACEKAMHKIDKVCYEGSRRAIMASLIVRNQNPIGKVPNRRQEVWYVDVIERMCV